MRNLNNLGSLIGTLNYKACFNCVHSNDDGVCPYDFALTNIIRIIDDKIYCEMFKEEE